MTGTEATSTGHQVAAPVYLESHYLSAQVEYEAALRQVGIQLGWSVLDAGCGGGSFLPLLSGLVGPAGHIAAIDLAPENIAHVDSRRRDGLLAAPVEARVGSLDGLPYPDDSFDCVWCANVVQYMTWEEFDRAVGEFRRVLRPGGIMAIKEVDISLQQVRPMDPGCLTRMVTAGRAARPQLVGPWGGSSLGARLRTLGVAVVARRGWMSEHWAPPAACTREFVTAIVRYFASLAADLDLSEADHAAWRDVARFPERLLDDPDFCSREFFVVTVGRN